MDDLAVATDVAAHPGWGRAIAGETPVSPTTKACKSRARRRFEASRYLTRKMARGGLHAGRHESSGAAMFDARAVSLRSRRRRGGGTRR
jgi:hypothetical protein